MLVVSNCSPEIAVPITVKIPDPITAPIPSAVSDHGPRVFFKLFSGFSESRISLSIDLRLSSWLASGELLAREIELIVVRPTQTRGGGSQGAAPCRLQAPNGHAMCATYAWIDRGMPSSLWLSSSREAPSGEPSAQPSCAPRASVSCVQSCLQPSWCLPYFFSFLFLKIAGSESFRLLRPGSGARSTRLADATVRSSPAARTFLPASSTQI